MFKKLKCLFCRHKYNPLSHTNDYTGTSIRTYTLLVCEKCDKAKLEIQEINNVDKIYKRWEALAGLNGGSKTLEPFKFGYTSADRAEMKNLLKSSHKLKLKKMKVDVKSFIEADEALSEDSWKVKNNG
jgi:hypothetical protein